MNARRSPGEQRAYVEGFRAGGHYALDAAGRHDVSEAWNRLFVQVGLLARTVPHCAESPELVGYTTTDDAENP